MKAQNGLTYVMNLKKMLFEMNNIPRAFVTAIFILLLSGQIFPQTERPSIQADGGLIFPHEKNIQMGIKSGFGFALPLTKKISLSIEFSYWKSSTEEETGKLFNGKLVISPILVSVYYDFWKEGIIAPYIFLGAGFVFSSFDIGNYISIPEIKINQKIKSGPGFQLGTGAHFKITEALRLFGEIGYLSRKAGAQTIIFDMNFGESTKDFSVNLDAIWLKLGLKYFL